jgi:hypothetical protein
VGDLAVEEPEAAHFFPVVAPDRVSSSHFGPSLGR